MLKRFRRLLGQMDESERSLLLYLADEMARRADDAKAKK
jgi:hypothetical protein